jgi:hypothetical protein
MSAPGRGICEPLHARVGREDPAHPLPLKAGPFAVDEPNLAKPERGGLVEIVGDDFRNLAGMERVQIERVGHRQRDRGIRIWGNRLVFRHDNPRIRLLGLTPTWGDTRIMTRDGRGSDGERGTFVPGRRPRIKDPPRHAYPLSATFSQPPPGNAGARQKKEELR